MTDRTEASVSTIREPAAFVQLAPEWDRIVRAMRRPSPFLLSDWLAACWKHNRQGRVLVHLARRDGALVAALPLVVRRTLGLRAAGILGYGTALLADAVIAPSEPPGTLERLLEHATTAHDFAALGGIPRGGALDRSGSVHLVERVEAPVLELSRPWEEIYREKVSGRHRSVDRRKRARLGEQGRVDVTVARTRGEVAAGLEEAFRLHALRWRGRNDGSGFAGDRGRAFHRDALGALADVDAVRIVFLRVGDQAIAFNLGLVVAGRFCSYRIGFDPDWSRWSPGYLNNLDAIAAAADEGLAAFEFLGGAEEHKLQLADRAEPVGDAFGLSRGVRGRTGVAVCVAGARTREWAKRSDRLRAAARAARAARNRVGRG